MMCVLVGIRLSLDELETLDALAEREHATRSEMVSRCVREHLAGEGRV